jgi:hypothetical protein
MDGGNRPVRTLLLAIVGLALAVLVGRAPASIVRRRRRLAAAPATGKSPGTWWGLG